MQQLYFVKKEKLEWRDVPEPVIANDLEALVRPVAAARCDLDEAFLFQNISLMLNLGHWLGITDKDIFNTFGKNFFKGAFPFGHECIAEVTQIGDNVKNIKIGDLVIVPFQISCGTCYNCFQGVTSACQKNSSIATFGFGKHLQFGGAVSDFLKIPYADAMLIKIPPKIDYVHMASIGDNVADAYGRVIPYLKENYDNKVLIVGGRAKSVSLYSVLIAKAFGSTEVHYASNNSECLAIAKKCGADKLFENFNQIQDKYDLVVDASSSQTGLNLAIKSLKNRGICTSTGIHFKKTQFPLIQLYVNGGSYITGLANARPDAEKCLTLVEQGLDLGIITSHLGKWNDAAESFLQPGVKIIVHRERITKNL